MSPQDENTYQQDSGTPDPTSEDSSAIPTDSGDTTDSTDSTGIDSTDPASAGQEDAGASPADVQVALQQANQQTQQPSESPPKPTGASLELIQGVIRAESATKGFPDGNPNATGPDTGKGRGTAKGLMQLLDGTGQQWHDKLGIEAPYNPYDPGQNKQIGTAYLNYLIDRYHGDTRLAVAAYNHGPKALDDDMTRWNAKTYDEVAAHLPPETQKYVPKVIGNNSVGRNSSTNGPTIDQIASSVPGTRKGFADGLLRVISDPSFDDLPLTKKLGRMDDLHKSKPSWESGTSDVIKFAASAYTDAAPLDQRPNLSDLVGVPPLVGANENPKDKLNNWAAGKTQELIRQGLNPALLGDQFDKYLATSTQDETDAWTARNRSTVGLVANRAANYTRDLAKGAIGLPASAVAGAARLVGAPETANSIESLPEILGKPAKDYLYVTDARGYPVQNPDGSLQTHWQSEMMQSIGMVGGAIASLGAGAYVGVGSKALAALNVTENSLSMANGTFKSVYQQTGSLSSAYKASLFVLPAAAVGSIGEIGVLSGLLRPELKALTTYDQARFIGLALTKNVIIGGAASGGADAILQAGEISQTGQKFSGERAGQATITGAVGTAVAGTVADSIIANKRFNDATVNRQNQVAVATKQLVDFRQGLASKVVTTTKPGDIPPEIATNLGVIIEPGSNGGSILTKKSNVVDNPNVTPQDIPTLITRLSSLPTPVDLTALAHEQLALNGKKDKTPEDNARLVQINAALDSGGKAAHLNDIKGVEAQVYTALQQDPGALPVRYDTGTKEWQNVETGNHTEFLADLLKPAPAEKAYEHDATNNNLNIIDEEVLQKTAVTPEVLQAKQDEVTQHSTLIDTLKAQKQTESEALTQIQGQHKDVLKAIDARDAIKVSIDKLTQQINELPKFGELTEPQKIANGKADSLRADLEKAKADLAAFKAINWSKLNPKEKKAVIEQGKAKGRTIQSIQAEILKNKAAVRAENLAAEKFKTQKGIDDHREVLTKKLNDKKSQFDSIKDTVPPDLEAQQQKVKAISDQLDAAKTRAKTLDTELGETKKAANEWVKTKKEIDGLGEILGAYASDGRLLLKAGLSPELKAVVTAHELGHAASDKITLPPDAELAMQGRLAEIKARALTLTVPELMGEVLLPGVSARMKVDPTKPFKTLTKKSQEAITSREELIANQIGAIILKRAGKDIGKYQILPEVEAALDKTRLPALPTPDNTILPKTSGESKAVETKAPVTEQTALPTETKAPVTEQTGAQSATFETTPPKPELVSSKIPFDLVFGPDKETAFSKTVRETIPGIPAERYPSMVQATNEANARAYVEKYGVKRTFEDLTVPESLSLDPRARTLITEAMMYKAAAEFDANPTAANRDRLSQIRQVYSHVNTVAAQQLSMVRRYRNTKSFADFLATVDKTFTDAGKESPTYTDFQLKELEVAYKQTEGLPDGVLRDLYTDKLFQKLMNGQGTGWKDLLIGYMRTNLLSGIGTQLMVGTSSLYMGPLVTALEHPIMGRGLLWRAMWSAKDLAYANAKRVFEGKGSYNMFGGMVEAKPLRPADYSSIPKVFGTLYAKFGNTVGNMLGASHAYARTLSTHGYIAKEKYISLKKQYGSDPAKFAAEVGKIILPKADKQAALIQAEKEGRALGLELSDADKYARAYEILTKGNTDAKLLTDATDWSYITSHIGDVANPLQAVGRALFNAHVWDEHPPLKFVKNVIEPFGRAMLALSDYAQDFIPGNLVLDKGYRWLSNRMDIGKLTPRTPAQEARLWAGQKIGVTFAAIALGMVRSGMVRITGEAEKQIGTDKGARATGRADFKEFAQKGDPEYSVIFDGLGGLSFNYKDYPGLNAILFGIHHMNKALDAGENPLSATVGFYGHAYVYALPFLGGGTLNSPSWTLVNTLMSEGATPKAMHKAFADFAVSTSKMVIPASALLRDVKNGYDTAVGNAPEESNQDITTRIFKDYPGVSHLIGSKPALDRFGDPQTRAGTEGIPGVGRLVGFTKAPTDAVWQKLWQKGITVPELKTTINFTKSDFLNAAAQKAYEASRDERLSNAYSNSFTPDEWYAFIKATGPYVKRIAESIADSDMPVDKAQQLLITRVRSIESEAKKRYVRSGQF